MSEGLKVLEALASAALAREGAPTPTQIRQLISALRLTPMCNEVEDEDAELLAKQIEARLGVVMTIGAVVTDEEFRPWLDVARPRITPYYWERYKKLLVSKNFPKQVVATLDDVTDRILGLLQDPTAPGPWDRRGMVVGHVQSGKTASYTGLICKAADAGYKLIVVIAGIHNNLRNQTQLRIDEGFVGRDSARLASKSADRFVGVGKFDNRRRPGTFTNSLKDFSKASASVAGVPLQNLNEPAIFVIKKNPTTLRHLVEWLREHSASASRKVDAPMLLIDDEADNASINVNQGSEAVSTINGLIRDLLNTFDRSCYVGYTATPFANIFIDPDTDDEMLGADLFPRNFIVSLDPPSNYFGPNEVFLNSSASIINHIEDAEDVLPLKHKKGHVVTSLPESLVEAIRTFVIGRAIRLLRGHVTAHSSMLVNASRFTDVQRQLRNEIHIKLNDIQASVRVNGNRDDAVKRDAEICALYETWQAEFAHTEFDWIDVQRALLDAAAPISVVEVNSRASGTLNYHDHAKTGLSVIAVGGLSLSRGLTLEGLMVSYFLRNSMMYDTLMQMGRWFGYRSGYEDLCRIWMPEEAEGWYTHVAESIEMLRDELRSMEAASATPQDFGLKVRSHPDTLIVTARNKMGTGEELVVSIGLANSFVETAILRGQPSILAKNRNAAVDFINRLANAGHPLTNAQVVAGGRLLSGISASHIIEFLTKFENHAGSFLTDGDPIRKYIEERQDTELAKWDVLIAGIAAGPDDQLENVLGVTFYRQRRSAGKRSNNETLHITNKQRVASRGVESVGLTPDQIAEARAAYRNKLSAEGKLDLDKPINYPDRIYRSVRERPLFILHLLKIDDQSVPERTSATAWSISFPRTELDEKRVEFIVNTTWLREHYKEDVDVGDEVIDDQ